MEDRSIKKLEDIVYWARGTLGALLGTFFAAFWRPNFGGLITAFSIALLVFLVSYYIINWLLGEVRVNLLGGKSKIYTLGIGVYFTSWIFFWIFFYTMFFHSF